MDINGIKIILFTRVNIIGGGVPLLLPAMTFTPSLLIFLAKIKKEKKKAPRLSPLRSERGPPTDDPPLNIKYSENEVF